MQYHLSASAWGPGFSVASALVDNHIKLASGLAFKALLLLLRSPEECFDETALAARLGANRADVSDALAYWLETGVLRADDGEASPMAARPLVVVPDCRVSAPMQPQPKQQPTQPVPQLRAAAALAPAARPRYPREEALSVIEGDHVLSSLLSEAQAVMGKPFTSADMDSLVGLFSFYGLSAHFIITVLHYCVSQGRRSMGYAESVAVSWLNEGVEDATVDQQVDRLLRRRSNEGRVRTAFGIERNLVPTERTMISRWFDDYHFELDIINLAYELTVERTGKLAFRYIDKILSSWHGQGIRSLEEAKAEQKPSKGKNGASSFDYAQLDTLV
ncbi:MAG: DnaD domain protein [Oscillospiraceae bacterium]